jgi:O-antigen ligase
MIFILMMTDHPLSAEYYINGENEMNAIKTSIFLMAAITLFPGISRADTLRLWTLKTVPT